MSVPKSSKYRGKTIRRRRASWQVDFGTKNGKRLQNSFRTKEDAKLAIDDSLEQQRITAIDHRNKHVAVYDLSDIQRIDVISARERLPRGATLTQAVEFFVKHTKPTGGAMTVSEVLAEYLEAKTKANRRPDSLKSIKTRIGRFAEKFGQVPVHEISTHDIERWMDGFEHGKVSRLNDRVYLVGFFNYAMKQEYVSQNPAERIERPILGEKIPEILTVAEAERLMLTARGSYPDMVPYFSICLFAGLRPNEAQNLDWRNVSLDARLITVRPEVAKRRRQRHVDISGNLLNWLAPFQQREGQLYFGRAHFEAARRDAGIPWANDILRHTFATYHLAKHQDAARTALQMGHVRSDVLFSHYKGELVTKEDTERFWSIRPVRSEGVLQFQATA